MFARAEKGRPVCSNENGSVVDNNKTIENIISDESAFH
jgi:hypothetical protein